ncbi:hypothetical protein ON010_g8188 [Phytophthora cinnamomi]|nr:hypothetical protein ON010_g8188 [Phytophthora cinnamomi]
MDATSIPLSTSCVWGYRSALVDVYRSKLLELDPQLDTELRRVLEGYEKVINDLKKRGLLKINEGKHQLKANGYELLARKFMTIEAMRKGPTLPTILLGCSDECLIVEEQGHKGDQTGTEKFGKHVYANPYEPSQCPIRALAVHLFSCLERSVTGKQQLFLGSDNKNRFGRMLRRAISTLNDEEMRTLSCIREDIGTHRLRKGSSSYALGQVNGPTPVSVYLRMGQRLGKLKDRYIHFDEGADQLCGRMTAGLPFNSEGFGVFLLPPHFPPQLLEKMTTAY